MVQQKVGTRAEPFIKVALKNKRTCLERCYNAKSSKCSCICAGVNHGIEVEANGPQQQSIQANGTLRFITREEFYKNALRERSPELDFGVWWRDGYNHPLYRVSWLEATGEIYAIDQSENRVEILGRARTRGDIEQKLEGWAKVCGLMNSLQWVRSKLL